MLDRPQLPGLQVTVSSAGELRVDREQPTRARAIVDVVLVGAALILDLLIWGFDGRSRLGITISPLVVMASAVPVFVALLSRRRRPWAAFLVVWLYSVCWGGLLPTYQPFIGLLVAVYHFARHHAAGVARGPLPLLAVPWGIDTYNAVVARGPTPTVLVVTAAIWSAIAATVWLVGRAGHRTQYGYELRTATQAAAAEAALEQQRLQLARELHDIVAHSISAVMFQAAGAQAAAQQLDPDLRAALNAIETSSTQAMRELRRLLGLMHPEAETTGSIEATASLDDLAPLLDTTRACSVTVRLREEGTPSPLDPSVDHTAYRVLQEGLANTMRHGGRGAEADIQLSWLPRTLRITVGSRTGPIADPPASSGGTGLGLGLSGLRQRVTGVGGRFDARPQPGGFLIHAVLPLSSTVRATVGAPCAVEAPGAHIASSRGQG